jgi:3-mercaptopyruvate sulfurtransferase SseA
VARQLIGRGFERVSALKGGWDAWIAAGHPLESR